jgi:hypothetical protein
MDVCGLASIAVEWMFRFVVRQGLGGPFLLTDLSDQ